MTLIRDEVAFFSKVDKVEHGSFDALQRIRALHSPPAVRVEFNGDAQDGTMRVYVHGASRTAALVAFEGNGRLMLMIQYQQGRAADGLLALARELGWNPPADWRKKKPTFYAGEWEKKTDAIVRLIESL